jgi:mannan endo-1,4-beta-mannosidase
MHRSANEPLSTDHPPRASVARSPLRFATLGGWLRSLVAVGMGAALLTTTVASTAATTAPSSTGAAGTADARTYAMTVDPSTVVRGEVTNVSGKVWKAARLRILIDGVVDGTNSRFRAGRDGTWRVGVVSNRKPGRHKVTLQAYTGGAWKQVSTASLTLVATATPTPAPSATPTTVPTSTPSATPTTVPTSTPSATPTTAPTSTPSATPTTATGFVTRQGTKLYLDGSAYRFTGLNIYNANSRDSCWYSMGNADNVLQTALTDIGGDTEVFRAWFFQRLAQSGGARDWKAFDHTLAVAKANGKRVVVTLTDHWGACDSGQKGDWFYGSGYRNVQAGDLVSYRDWVKEIVTRYRDDPTILMWQLVNEAESATHSNLYEFANDVARVVRGIDGRHLISLGTIGSGQPGTAGDDYRKLHAIPEIDVCEYHDYRPASEYFPTMPSQLQERLSQCNALGKPIFVGETGIKLDEVGNSTTERAALLDAKIEAQFGAGVVGVLPWAWVGRGQSAYESYLIGPGDPALTILGRH